MWMSDTPSLCASMIMLLINRTSELSDCSIGLSSSNMRSSVSFSSDSTSLSVSLKLKSNLIGTDGASAVQR